MEPIITSKNATEISKNPSRTSHGKKILLIFFLTLAVLLPSAILIELSIHHGRNPTTNTTHPNPSPHSIINETCTKTLYPSLCFNTLSSIPASVRVTTTQNILEISINETVKSVQSSRSNISTLFTHQDLISHEKNALNDCMEMMDQTHYELGQAVKEIQNFSDLTGFFHQFYGELKTLLSAAMTNENTCIEGISDVEEANPETQKGLKVYLQNLLNPISKMISNCLAIVKHMESFSPGQKMMITRTPSDGFPLWMTARDRKLMEIVPEIRPNVIVASDGSGDYRSINEAVRMAPNMSINRYVIKIKAGVYKENVEISREKANIMLVGDGMDSTVITGCKNFFDGFSTFNSATLTVIGNRFLARDLTIINTSGPEKHQAVALRVTSDSAFYKCNFTSYQDTLYAHSLRQFYSRCTIQGTIDFIFGNAAAVFQNCLILVRKPNPDQKNMITAQGREDPNQNTGISLQNCIIKAAPDLVEAGTGIFFTFLGRPWRNFSRTIVMKSYLGDLIHPQGWHEWNQYSTLDTVEYIEYMNVGPGSDTRGRVAWGWYNRNISEEIAKQFTVGKFLHGADDWLESTGFPFF
ncbi:Pectinesterase [Macleaya cordata]|uniref:Pectinesterase n=1 Tax=Macleaya cordata TaxID=56857 RepID=A0A200QRA1_MACCD|nr:Pectinesterase [Macleaya cordata]